MQLFQCANCQQTLFYENSQCVGCGQPLGFEVRRQQLLNLVEQPDGSLALPDQDSPRYRYCGNRPRVGCNWLVPVADGEELCQACRYNETIPDLADPAHLEQWTRLETAKRRMLYSLLRLGCLPPNRLEAPRRGLAFRFLAQTTDPDAEPVLTGHDDGIITLNIAEADPAHREAERDRMGERYRTLLGHFRHEVGHYFWFWRVQDGPQVEACRERFGDERADYAEALDAHYENGPAANWPEQHISAYASSHPFEDWAETFAHYLHVVDTLETAHAWGLRVQPGPADLSGTVDDNPYEQADFARIIDAWTPVSLALNSLNRSMGQADAYPFVIPAPVRDKLSCVHQAVHQAL